MKGCKNKFLKDKIAMLWLLCKLEISGYAPCVGVATMVMLASRTGMDLANQVLIL